MISDKDGKDILFKAQMQSRERLGRMMMKDSRHAALADLLDGLDDYMRDGSAAKILGDANSEDCEMTEEQTVEAVKRMIYLATTAAQIAGVWKGLREATK